MYEKISPIRMINGENQDLAVERICVEFKCAVRNNDFFWLSTDSKKVVAFSTGWGKGKGYWFDLAIEKLKKLGYDGFSHYMTSCPHGVYYEFLWDTAVEQDILSLQRAQLLNSY